MGKKRRIMTSGMKFVKKYRTFLEKAGKNDASDSAIDLPGMKPFVSELEVIAHGNQTFAFKCLVEGDIEDNDTLQVKLNGTLIQELNIPNAAGANSVSVNGLVPAEVICVLPTSNADAAGCDDINDAEAKSEDHIALDADANVLVAPVGSNTLEVVVKQGGATALSKRFGKSVKFNVPQAKVDLSKITALVNGAAAAATIDLSVLGNNDAELNVGASAAGSCPGEFSFNLAPGAAGNKVQILVFVNDAAAPIADPGGGFPASTHPIGAVHGISSGALGLNAGDTVTVKIKAVGVQDHAVPLEAELLNDASEIVLGPFEIPAAP